MYTLWFATFLARISNYIVVIAVTLSFIYLSQILKGDSIGDSR